MGISPFFADCTFMIDRLWKKTGWDKNDRIVNCRLEPDARVMQLTPLVGIGKLEGLKVIINGLWLN